ncbi:glycoside hydrolase superfamily [Earliella scabrosa]|nr:glycoside hydrolase superfamily [Earliella scabrosa]
MKSLAAIVALATFLAVPATAVPVWGQCGVRTHGQGWTGGTTCDAGTTCVKLNDWYSQCQPGSAPGPTSNPPPGPTTTTTNPGSPAATGLDKAFKAKGKKFFGTCSDSNRFNNPTGSAVTIREFGQVTPENSMKWDATEPSRGSFNYGNADALVNYATQNGMQIRGHTLVWHSQLPGWVSQINDRTTLTSVIQNHISNLAGRYAGKLYAWDVVNEIFNEDGSFRSSVFYNVLGRDFVTIAFQAARRADPTAKLYINDYNLDSVNSKVNGVVTLVNQINSANNPKLIDGIGTQMHLQQGGSSGALAVLQRLASADVEEVAITELDIVNAPANDYSAVTRACLQVPKCVSITVWGVRDPDSWRASSNPLLFDGNFNPKPAYTAVMQALA